jgi:hypothetical protein
MQWGTEMVIRHQLGKDINQKKMEKNADITPLLSASSSLQKHLDDTKLMRTVDHAEIT